MGTLARPSSIRAILGGCVPIAFVAAAFAGLAHGSPAAAQSTAFPAFTARLGGYVLESNTKIRLDALGSNGSEVEFEDELGLDKNQNLAVVNLEWQATNRNLFRLGYYSVDRSGERTLTDRSITIGGVNYPIGSKVSADVKTSVYEVDWTFWLIRGGRSGLGAALGASVLDLDASASAQVHVGNFTQTRSSDASVTTPIPSIGLEGRAEITPRFLLLGYARVLPNITVGDVNGDALQYNAAAEWMPFSHAGIGISYHGFEVNDEVDAENYNGGLELHTSGWQLYARFST
jgi:hypothetical protein